jgi:ABC-type transporter Mla MlaB component
MSEDSLILGSAVTSVTPISSGAVFRLPAMEEARAVAVLERAGQQVVLGPVDAMGSGGLALVDDLLRLQLLAGRLGWQLRLTEVHAELRELFELVGLTSHLEP